MASCLVVQVETGATTTTTTNQNKNKMAANPNRKISLEDGNPEGLDLLRKSLKCVREENVSSENDIESSSHIFVVFGASGDLAKKKIYPTLWALFKERLMPKQTRIVGYARSKISVEGIREKCKPWLKVSYFEINMLVVVLYRRSSHSVWKMVLGKIHTAHRGL